MSDTSADSGPMPVFSPSGRMMGNLTSDQGTPPTSVLSDAPLPAFLKKEAAGLEGVQKADEAAFAQRNAAMLKPMSALSNMGGAPQAPEQQKIGPAPDAKEYQKNSKEFLGAMAVLGAVASAFTRRQGTAALSAFAGAVNGWQSGNLQAYEEAAKKWEQDTKATLDNNRMIMEKYKLALENRKMNIDEQMSQIQLISTQYHDKIMYDAAAAKNYTLVAQVYEKNHEFTTKATDAAGKLQEKRDEQKQKNEQSAAYWLSPEGQTRFAQLPPVQQAAVKQLIDIFAQKAVGKSAVAQDRQQYINEYTAEHGAAPTSDQITSWEGERAGKTAEGAAVGRRAGGISIAVDEAHQTIPNVMAAAEKSAGKGYAIWNKLENRWNVQKGDEDFAFYVQQINSLINVYGRVISGGGKGTVSDLEHAREMLNPNMPLSAVKGSLRGFSTEVDIAEKAPDRVRSRMKGSAAPPDSTKEGWTDFGNGVRIREKP